MNNAGGSIPPSAGTKLAGNSAHIPGFRPGCVPTNGPGRAVTPRDHFFTAPNVIPFRPSFRANLTHAVLPLPGAAHWRSLLGKSGAGPLFRSRGGRQSPQGGWCDELVAQRLTLRPRAVGLPHHRHPMTADEALAGIIVGLVVLAGVVFAIARLA